MPLEKYRQRRGEPAAGTRGGYARSLAKSAKEVAVAALLATWWVVGGVAGVGGWLVGWGWVINEYDTGGNVAAATLVAVLMVLVAVSAGVLWHRGLMPGGGVSGRLRAAAALFVIAALLVLRYLWEEVVLVDTWGPYVIDRPNNWLLVAAAGGLVMLAVGVVHATGEPVSPGRRSV